MWEMACIFFFHPPATACTFYFMWLRCHTSDVRREVAAAAVRPPPHPTPPTFKLGLVVTVFLVGFNWCSKYFIFFFIKYVVIYQKYIPSQFRSTQLHQAMNTFRRIKQSLPKATLKVNKTNRQQEFERNSSRQLEGRRHVWTGTSCRSSLKVHASSCLHNIDIKVILLKATGLARLQCFGKFHWYGQTWILPLPGYLLQLTFSMCLLGNTYHCLEDGRYLSLLKARN